MIQWQSKSPLACSLAVVCIIHMYVEHIGSKYYPHSGYFIYLLRRSPYQSLGSKSRFDIGSWCSSQYLSISDPYRNTVFLQDTRQKYSISVGLGFTLNLASGTQTSLQPLVTLSLLIERNLQFFERALPASGIKPAFFRFLDRCSSLLS